MSIQAEAYSDDHNVEVKFDALAWFEQASDAEILALIRCEWGGDYPADAVAEFIASLAAPYGRRDAAELAGLFDYLALIRNDASKKDLYGFECHILDREAALDWIQAHRPAVVRELLLDNYK